MKGVLCDVHIAYKVTRFFAEKGLNAVHVNDVLDSWFTQDQAICAYADAHDLMVVTKDADFKNSYLVEDTPKKLLKISLGNTSTKILLALLESNYAVLQKQFEKERFLIELGQYQIEIID
ncbi:MAG: DUF5615 family PIN-like protein [Bernardetiaceae bacterium]